MLQIDSSWGSGIRKNGEGLPPALIMQGTLDIARPIYWELKSKKIPVYYLVYDRDDLSANISSSEVITIQNGSLDGNSIEQILNRTGAFDKKLIVFPTNEVSLNRCLPLAAYHSGKRFHIPGSIGYPEKLDAFGITNKDIFFESTWRVLKRLENEKFRLAKSSILRKQDDLENFASAVDYYPVTIKPARKDPFDSFTNSQKAKLLVAGDSRELVRISMGLFGDFETPFLVQEKIDFSDEFTWAGMRMKGYCLGAVQIERIKLPHFGGTAVLTEMVNNKEIEKIATSILSLLDFEGICEIGFLVKDNIAYFTFEVNPRGWLQVDILFSVGLDIYSSYYLLFNGVPLSVDDREIIGPPSKKVVWASVNRYVALAQNPKLLEALRMLKYDISHRYDDRNKVRATLSLIRQVLKKNLRWLRGGQKWS
jgi:hypothetical protein